MTKIKLFLHLLVARVVDFIEREPVRAGSIAVAAVVAVAGQLGFILDEQSILSTVTTVVVILGGGEAARKKVTPV